jgi:branched-chain amino acid transport system substrate-binding protein
MLGVEGIRKAQGKFGKTPLTGEQIRWGLEHLQLDQVRLKELGFEGMMMPVKVSCADHEGARTAPRAALGRQNVESDFRLVHRG